MSKILHGSVAALLTAVLCTGLNAQEQDEKQESKSAVELVQAEKQEKKQEKVKKEKQKKPPKLEATHKQVQAFKPKYDGKPIALNTFCVSDRGEILACVGGTNYVPVQKDGKYEMKAVQQPALLQFYSHELKFIKQIKLRFTPTAINVDKSGNIYVGGDGKIAKLDREGNELLTAGSPSLKAEKELREQIKKNLEKQYKETMLTYKKQIERLEKKIAEIEEVDEEERTKRQERRLKSYQAQLKSFESSSKTMANFYKPTDERIEQSIKEAKAIKSIAVNDKDVFVTCAAPGTYGYEIWRVNQKLEEPTRVLENVSGCCGQMDIQARGEHLYVAENTKFRVAVYDRDGEEVSKFGSRTTTGQQGFGSCCNPMNIRCCDNGEVLTAESSIGHIKRFNAAGELIAYVGRARIGGGCKHVAMGHDTERDIYYMMYQDESSICVLRPASEVGETLAEKNAKEAAEGLGKKVVGSWAHVSEKKEDKKSDKGTASGAISTAALTSFKSFELQKDGTFKYKFDSNIGIGWKFKWVPVKQEGKKLWLNLVDEQDITTMSMVVELKSDDELIAEVKFSTSSGKKRSFKRVKEKTETDTSTKSEDGEKK